MLFHIENDLRFLTVTFTLGYQSINQLKQIYMAPCDVSQANQEAFAERQRHRSNIQENIVKERMHQLPSHTD